MHGYLRKYLDSWRGSIEKLILFFCYISAHVQPSSRKNVPRVNRLLLAIIGYKWYWNVKHTFIVQVVQFVTNIRC